MTEREAARGARAVSARTPHLTRLTRDANFLTPLQDMGGEFSTGRVQRAVTK